MIRLNVRQANKGDLSKLKELDAKDQFFVDELEEYHTLLDDDEYVQYFLKNKSFFIAEADDKIVGFLIAQIKDWMFHHKKIIWIDHIVVDPDRRREGIAQIMIKEMVNHYTKKDKKISHVYSIINPDNKASLDFSKKFDPFSKTIFMISKKLK